jgi:hypothetical protein
MTGERQYPSAVTAWVNGALAGRYELADDPADHRGILSWHSQLRDRYLREAGSYGELLRVAIPRPRWRRRSARALRRAPGGIGRAAGGLAIYGAKFGGIRSIRRSRSFSGGHRRRRGEAARASVQNPSWPESGRR